MPLTKLARRYHMQRRPCEAQEPCFATPSRAAFSNDIRKELQFEDEKQPPPYVTVRKKKPEKRNNLDFSLHTTVIESGNFAVTDCQSWKRHESTHVDHVAEALGHLTIWTDDISAIQPENNDESFKTAFEAPQAEASEHRERIFAEDSEDEFVGNVINSPKSRITDWVLNSPFQSPEVRGKNETLSVSGDECSTDHHVEDTNATSKGYGEDSENKERIFAEDSEDESVVKVINSPSSRIPEWALNSPFHSPEVRGKNETLSGSGNECSTDHHVEDTNATSKGYGEDSGNKERIFAEDSEDESVVKVMKSPSSRIPEWALNSPSHSPKVAYETTLISESDDESNSSIEETSKSQDIIDRSPRVSEWVLNSPFQSPVQDSPVVFHVSHSFDTPSDCKENSQVTSKRYVSQKDKIADLWCLDNDQRSFLSEDQRDSRSVNLQVSFSSEDEKRSSVGVQVSLSSSDEEEIKPSSASSEENTLSEVCSRKNSSGNVLFLEDDEESETKGTLSFLTSLSLESPSSQCHPEAVKYVKNFSRHKNELLARLYLLFNKEAFDNQLPSDLPVVWNGRLTKSAGVCVQRKIRVNEEEERISKIELSTKVIDSPDRLRDTLIHEMCHAAAWIQSGVRDGHGTFWKAWSNKAMSAFPELPIIARCHSYVIRTKFTYLCQKCGQRIGRHSKSIDVKKQTCKLCGGSFQLLLNDRKHLNKALA